MVHHISYDNFGNVTGQTAAVDHLFGYTGKLSDPATGLQNNLHRWYDAEVGRWLSEDPIGFAAGDANLSRYVGNGPANDVDPSGLVVETVWDGVNVGVGGTKKSGCQLVRLLDCNHQIHRRPDLLRTRSNRY